MMSRKGVILLLVLLTFSIITVLCVLIGVFLYVYLQTSVKSGPVHKETQYFKLTEINALKKETTNGIVRLPKEQLSGKDFISYRNERSGGLVIISRNEGKEYECSGSCHCNDNRRSSVTLSRGLSFVIAALSATTAASIAKEAFREECMVHFGESCEDFSAELGSCVVEESKEFLPDQGVAKTYLCSGNCVNNEEFDDDPISINAYEQYWSSFGEFECEGLKTSGKIMIDCGPEWKRYQCMMKAVGHFHGKVLDPFCRKKTKFSFLRKREKTWFRYDKVPAVACRGKSKFAVITDVILDNMTCNEVS